MSRKFNKLDYYPQESDYEELTKYFYQKFNFYILGVSIRQLSDFLFGINNLYNNDKYYVNYKKAIENTLFILNVLEKNRKIYFFHDFELFLIMYCSLVKNALITNSQIKQYLLKTKMLDNFSKDESVKMLDLLAICTGFYSYTDLMKQKFDKKVFLKILMKISDDSFYFKNFSINYSWILFYYQDYDFNNEISINKIQIDYIENSIKPLFNHLIINKMIGLIEYQDNLKKNLDFWKMNKNVNRKQFINGVI